MKQISQSEFLRLRKFVHRDSRPLDFTKWKYLFEGGSCEDFLSVLASYQNEDGGFGYNIECNNWNPNSSPYTVSIALDYLDVADTNVSVIKDRIISGILKYLAAGEYLLDDGWVGMQGVPSNNEYSHMPWFHYVPEMAKTADIGLTKRLSDFVLKYADPKCEIFHNCEAFMEKYKSSTKYLLNGYPDYDPEEYNLKAYSPETWQAWLPLPVYFIGSPKSPFYPGLERVADMNLDLIIDGLEKTTEINVASEEDLKTYEEGNPHPDGKKWCDNRQAIGNYYWGTAFIVRDFDILRKFGRLDFTLPVCAL